MCSIHKEFVLLLQRVEDVLFFDKRDNSEFGEPVICVSQYYWAGYQHGYVCVQVYSLLFSIPLDLLTVSEKAKEPPHDESGINAPTSLALEATYINHNFSQQMLIVSPTHITCIQNCFNFQYSSNLFWTTCMFMQRDKNFVDGQFCFAGRADHGLQRA